MVVQLALSIALFFFLLVGLMMFYLHYQSKVPYYRMSESDCVDLLTKAVQGELQERDWDVFIGMTVRDNRQVEALREECCLIDEQHRKATYRRNGKQYVQFHSKGQERLLGLLDEWQHKKSVVA